MSGIRMSVKVFWIICLIFVSESINAFITGGSGLTNYSLKTPENYWQLLTDGLYLNTYNCINGGYSHNSGYGWGYNLQANYNFKSNKAFIVGWVDYKNNETRTNDSNIDIFQEGVNDYHSNYKFKIRVIELQVAQMMSFRDKLGFALYGGIQYFNLVEKENYRYQSAISLSDISANNIYRVQGVGPDLGLSIGYFFDEKWTLFADGSFVTFFGFLNNAVDLNYVDRRHPQPIDKSFSQPSKGTFPVAAQYADAGLSYAAYLFEGRVNLRGGILGASYALGGLRFSGLFFGAVCFGNG